jgi:pimeloyl-ACP methyl ester carboxylesterase
MLARPGGQVDGVPVARPQTRYAKSGAVNVAYQVLGDGPLDLVLVPGFVSHVEVAWERPLLAHLLSRLAAFSRLIVFDKRGTGLSDSVGAPPSMDERMDDLRAVPAWPT